MKNFTSIACLSLCLFINQLSAQKYTPDWASIDSRPVPGWFTDAKFGIFIHWGVYSVPSWGPKGSYAEWYWWAQHDTASETYKHHLKIYGANFKYQDFAPQFKAELFDADKWADLFLKSGAKYIVPTSKHHEGFCLWPSKESWNWNSYDAGPHKDLLDELSQSVRAKGLKFGVYYSLLEWFNPLYRNEFPRFVDEHFFPQFKDLVTRYKPSLIFTDGEWEKTSAEWKTPQLLSWLYNESPVKNEVAINDRWGSETRSTHGGYFCTEYGGLAAKEMTQDHPWEENRGIGGSFGFNRNEDIGDYRSADELINILTTTVSQGGNLLLDIGPDADGTIPVIMQERLLQIGDWLKVNGEAIYATRPFRVWQEGENMRFTRSKDGKYLYLIVLKNLPKTIHTAMASLAPGTAVTMLGTNEKMNYKKENGELVIDVPDSLLSNKPCEHAWVFKMEALPFLGKAKFATPQELSEKPEAIAIQSDNTAELHYTTDGTEPTLASPVYKQPVKIDKTTTIAATAFKQGFEQSPTLMHSFVVVDNKVNGLNYNLYHGAWTKLPDFSTLKPIKTGVTYDLSFDKITDVAYGFGIVYEGFINIEKEGDYTFTVGSDDGSRLTVNGSTVIENDGVHLMAVKDATVHLPAGKLPFRFEYFQEQGGKALDVKYSGPGIAKQSITPSLLFRK